MTQLITTAEAARMCGLSPGTLQKWRVVGRGPAFVKAGNAVRYRVEDVEAWIVSRRRTSTVEPSLFIRIDPVRIDIIAGDAATEAELSVLADRISGALDPKED